MSRGVFSLRDVRAADVAAYAPWRQSQLYRGRSVGVAACNRDLAALKALFSWAVRTERFQANPAERIPLAREHRRVERIVIVELEEFERVLPLLTEQWRNTAVALLGTGMRWGSLAALKPGDLDPRRRSVKLRRPKGKVGVDLLVSERTWEALRAVAGKTAPDSSGAFAKAVAQACNQVGVRAWTAHHLRHTFACTCLRNGDDLRQVQAWLGHSSVQTTEHYLHFVQAKKPRGPL